MCIFCGALQIIRTTRGHIKCQGCGKSKTYLAHASDRHNAMVLPEQPAYRHATDLGVKVYVMKYSGDVPNLYSITIAVHTRVISQCT